MKFKNTFIIKPKINTPTVFQAITTYYYKPHHTLQRIPWLVDIHFMLFPFLDENHSYQPEEDQGERGNTPPL